MSANENIDFAGGSVGQNFFNFLCAAEAADQFDAYGKRGESPLERFVVLKCEHGSRRQQRDLFAVAQEP